MQRQHKLVSFENAVLPHLDAAYNLARWLTRDVNDAEDVVQDACVRALNGVLNEHRAHPRKSAFPNFDGAIADALSPKVSR